MSDRTIEDYRALFNAFLRGSFDGVTLNSVESRTFLDVSDSFCEMTGYTRDELVGQAPLEMGLVEPSTVHSIALADARRGREGLYETCLIRRDGSRLWIEFSNQALGNGFVLSIVRDITERRAVEQELRTLADTDPLTAVFNRRKFQSEAERKIATARDRGTHVSLAVVDVDCLKKVNDDDGHQAGDALLLRLADVMREVTETDDPIGRLGGDEFAMLMSQRSEAEAGAVSSALAARLHATDFRALGCSNPLSASIGLAHAVGESASFDGLLSAADRAMYRQKHKRRQSIGTRGADSN